MFFVSGSLVEGGSLLRVKHKYDQDGVYNKVGNSTEEHVVVFYEIFPEKANCEQNDYQVKHPKQLVSVPGLRVKPVVLKYDERTSTKPGDCLNQVDQSVPIQATLIHKARASAIGRKDEVR